MIRKRKKLVKDNVKGETMKVVIFNCPPRSGKDAVAEIIKEKRGIPTFSFKKRLIEIALAISGVSHEVWNARYETKKDEPWDKTFGLSQRQFLITVSEDLIKPNFGQDYFGIALARQISVYQGNADFCIVTDGGFESEIKPLEAYGHSVKILQWEATFSGARTNFDNDSRNYVYTADTHRLPDNDSSLSGFAAYVYNYIAKDWQVGKITKNAKEN